MHLSRLLVAFLLILFISYSSANVDYLSLVEPTSILNQRAGVTLTFSFNFNGTDLERNSTNIAIDAISISSSTVLLKTEYIATVDDCPTFVNTSSYFECSINYVIPLEAADYNIYFNLMINDTLTASTTVVSTVNILTIYSPLQLMYTNTALTNPYSFLVAAGDRKDIDFAFTLSDDNETSTVSDLTVSLYLYDLSTNNSLASQENIPILCDSEALLYSCSIYSFYFPASSSETNCYFYLQIDNEMYSYLMSANFHVNATFVPVECDPVEDCNDHGFCNYLGHCVCFPHYKGVDCSSEVDSEGLTDGAVAGIVLTFLLGLPLVLLVCIILYKKGYYLLNRDMNKLQKSNFPLGDISEREK